MGMMAGSTNNSMINQGTAAHEERAYSIKQTAAVLLVISLLTVALRAPLLDVPFERDEGEYAYIAWRLGFDELPYRDWVDQKPPGIFWAYRLALGMPGDPIRAVHLLGTLFALLSASGLYFLSRRLIGVAGGMVSAVALVVFSADPLMQGSTANTELFMSLPVILSHILFLRGAANCRKSAVPMMLAGAMVGIAAAFKQVAAANLLFFIAAFPLLQQRGERLRGAVSFFVWSSLGLAAIWGAVAVYFYTHKGLGDFIYNVFTHNLDYIQALPFSLRLNNLTGTLSALSASQATFWAFAAAGLIALFISGRRRLAFYMAGWSLANMAGVSSSGYFFPHYFQQILPSAAILAAVGTSALYGVHRWVKVPRLARGVILCLVFFIPPALSFYPFLFEYTPQQASRKMYPNNSFAEMPEMGMRLAALTRPDDRIFIFGAEPELLFYSQRASATRYIFLFPLYGPYGDALARQKDAMEEIVRNRPAALVYLPNNLFFMRGMEQYLTKRVMEYLARYFVLDSLLAEDGSGGVDLISGPRRGALLEASGQQLPTGIFVRERRE